VVSIFGSDDSHSRARNVTATVARAFHASFEHLPSRVLSPCALHSNHNKHRMCGWCYAAVVDVAASDWTHNETFILASYAASFAGAYRLCLPKLSICIQISIKQQWTPAITSARSMAYLPSLIRIFIEDLHPLTSERRLPFHERLVQHFSEADQNPSKAYHVLLT
jgi:hypothetical protein